MLIDTHAHLYDEQFQDELATQIEKGKNLGLERILLPNIDVE